MKLRHYTLVSKTGIEKNVSFMVSRYTKAEIKQKTYRRTKIIDLFDVDVETFRSFLISNSPLQLKKKIGFNGVNNAYHFKGAENLEVYGEDRPLSDYILNRYLNTGADHATCSGIWILAVNNEILNVDQTHMYFKLKGERTGQSWGFAPTGYGDYLKVPEQTCDTFFKPGFVYSFVSSDGYLFYFQALYASYNHLDTMLHSLVKTLIDDYGEVFINAEYTESEFNPNDDGDSEEGDEIMNRFAPVTQSNGTGLYMMDKPKVHSLFKNLYNYTLWEGVTDFLKLFGDSNGLIQSLRWYYGIKDGIRYEERERVITIGNKELNDSTGVSVRGNALLTEYAYKESGIVHITPSFNNFLDYSGYTRIVVHVPFHGMVELKPEEVMGKYLKLRYRFDLAKGTGYCFVTIVSSNGDNVRDILSIPVSPAVEIPLQSTSVNPLGAVSGVIQNSLNLASLYSPTVAGGVGAYNGSVGNIMNTIGGYNNNVSLGGNSGGVEQLSDFRAYVTIIRPVVLNIEDVMRAEGGVVEKIKRIGDLSGYVKTGNIVSIGSCKYKSKIENLLKEGVYL